MNERMIVLDVYAGQVGITLGANFYYRYLPFDLTIIAVECAPSADDAGLTIDINDDTVGVISAIVCDDADVPTIWKSTHVGGANAPVFIAAGSELTLDANNAAADTNVHVGIWALVGEVSA